MVSGNIRTVLYSSLKVQQYWRYVVDWRCENMGIADEINKTQKEETNKNKGYPLKYTGENCPKCGRTRVEKWTTGDRICEKCKWNIDKEKYERFNY